MSDTTNPGTFTMNQQTELGQGLLKPRPAIKERLNQAAFAEYKDLSRAYRELVMVWIETGQEDEGLRHEILALRARLNELEG